MNDNIPLKPQRTYKLPKGTECNKVPTQKVPSTGDTCDGEMGKSNGVHGRKLSPPPLNGLRPDRAKQATDVRTGQENGNKYKMQATASAGERPGKD